MFIAILMGAWLAWELVSRTRSGRPGRGMGGLVGGPGSSTERKNNCLKLGSPPQPNSFFNHFMRLEVRNSKYFFAGGLMAHACG